METFYNSVFNKIGENTWRDKLTNYVYHMEDRIPFFSLLVWLGVGEYSYEELLEKGKID